MNYIQTDGGLHIILQGQTKTLHKTDPHFAAVVQAIKDKKTEAEVLEIIEAEKRRMEEAVQVVPGIEMKGGQLYHNGEVIAGVLGTRMLQMLEEGFDLTPMAAFLANLQENPSMRVVGHLYAFLEHGKNPITDDGHFLAYKAIREDWTSIHAAPDGTHLDNSIGKVVEMPRNKVDENPERTCSYGLHVCSFDYLPHFSHANGHVVVVKVNPRDVVAIPADYNNTKMRVCRYEVIAEHEGYYQNKGDTLSAASVNNDGSGGTFIVYSRSDAGDSFTEDDSFDRLSDAASRMEELLDDDSIHSVRIVNRETGAIVDERENANFDGDSSSGGFFGGSDDDTYTVYAIHADGREELLDDGFESVSDAVSFAIDQSGAERYEIRDENGNVEKTIS